GRDGPEIVAAVEGAKDVVAGTVVDFRVVVREQKRRLPIEAEALAGLRPRPERGLFAGAPVAPAHAAVLALGVNKIGVVRIDGADEAVTAADVDPVLIDRPGWSARAAGTAPAAGG